jgi:hypothetical protein
VVEVEDDDPSLRYCGTDSSPPKTGRYQSADDRTNAAGLNGDDAAAVEDDVLSIELAVPAESFDEE